MEKLRITLPFSLPLLSHQLLTNTEILTWELKGGVQAQTLLVMKLMLSTNSIQALSTNVTP